MEAITGCETENTYKIFEADVYFYFLEFFL